MWACFSTDGNVPLSTHTLKNWQMQLPKMSAFCFSIFTGMSVFGIAFLLPNLLISFKISSTLTFKKLKLCGSNAFLITDTLGWLRNFIIAFKAGWEMHSAEKSISLKSGIFKCFATLEIKTNLVS